MNKAGEQIAELEERANVQAELQYTYISVNNILSEVEYITSEVRHHIDDLVLASKGIVTTNLISLDEISQVLHEAKIRYYLDPVFNTAQLSSYYYFDNGCSFCT